MTEVYIENRGFATADPPKRRGVGVVKPIEAAKALIPTIDLADRLCEPAQMRRIGEKWVARCPLPDHDDKTPSFVVYPGDRGWFCYGCERGGDVVDLARLAWGYPDDGPGAATAAAFLLMEFGHQIPDRPRSWFARQERQKPVRDAIEEAKVGHLQRRVFRRFVPLIESIEDSGERREEIEHLWEAAEQIAVLIWAGRKVS